MVLSDSDYHIKIPITNKSTDQDTLSVVFKKLAGDEGEEPIGKYLLSSNFRLI